MNLHVKPSYFILMILILLSGLAIGQHVPVYFRHYQVEDGLSNNTVFSIFQDSRGFIWLGTKEGLNRFDGTSFKAFDMKLNKYQSTKEFVFSIAEGVQHTLWIGTRKGLYEFDPRTEHFRPIVSTQEHEILTILSDGQGKIWFTADAKLYRYDEHTARIQHYDIPGEQITAMTVAHDKSIWIGSHSGSILRYDAAKDMFQCANCTKADLGKRPRYINDIFVHESDMILIGTIHGLSSYEPAKNLYRPLLGVEVNGSDVYVRDILPFSADEYWVASESGVHSINIRTGQTSVMRQRDADPYSISDNAIYALFRDYEGGIWCGSYFGGANYYHPSHAYFKKYFRTDSLQSISGHAVRELCPDGHGYLWIGTEDAGLNKMDLRNGVVTRVSSPAMGATANIHALTVDGEELWAGTFQQGLHVIDLRTGRHKRHYLADPQMNGLRSNFIISSCRTSSGVLLFGTSRGIHHYQRGTDRFELSPWFPEDIYVFCLYEDTNGVIWAGTIGKGLYFYDTKTGKKGNFRANDKESNSLSMNSVCGIFEDSHQQLWISTEGGGLCRLDKARRSFDHFGTEDGLPSNMVYRVLEDNRRQLWISTSQGLARYDPVHDRWKNYTQAHGLLTGQFNYSSSYRDTSGNLYFGSVKGLISFNPQNLQDKTVPPPIYITRFQVHNQDLPIGDAQTLPCAVSFVDTLRLQYDQSSFSVDFAALSYTSASMTAYFYKMEGLDNAWTYLPNNRTVYFTKLTPGNYTFRVRTADGSTSSERTLHIRISPPWWLSPVAYLLYTIALSVLIYMLVKIYHRRQKERHRRKLGLFEQEKEKEIYKSKIEFFTHIAHEIRTPLTLIKGPLEMVMDEVGEQQHLRKNLKSIERNTDRLISLTDQLLDFRRMENEGYMLNFVKVNVPKLLKDICQPFSADAEQRQLVFTIDLPPNPFYAFVDIEAFHKIIDNLVGNAIKYASKDIVVRLTTLEDAKQELFQIEVSNDGTIIPWSMRNKIFEPFFRIDTTQQSGSGIGLSLALSLTELHRGTLELIQSSENLNTFQLRLPKHQQVEFSLKTITKKTK